MKTGRNEIRTATKNDQGKRHPSRKKTPYANDKREKPRAQQVPPKSGNRKLPWPKEKAPPSPLRKKKKGGKPPTAKKVAEFGGEKRKDATRPLIKEGPPQDGPIGKKKRLQYRLQEKSQLKVSTDRREKLPFHQF